MLKVTIIIAKCYLMNIYNLASLFSCKVIAIPIDDNTVQIEFAIYKEATNEFFETIRATDFFKHYYESYDMIINNGNFDRYYRVADYNAYIDSVTTLIQLDD